MLTPLLLSVGLLITGCGDGDSQGGGAHNGTTLPGTPSPNTPSRPANPPGSTPPASTPLADTDWTTVIDDIDCRITGNEGIEVLGTRFADVRGKGVPDALVWFDCVHRASTWPDQLEVFDGTSSPTAPRRLAVLVSAEEKVNGRGVKISAVSTHGATVVVDLRAYEPTDPMFQPSKRLRRTFTWRGDRFVQEPATP
ncbi:hypothetical protein [Streptomyces sp. MST-110588]|uniref:hypothetical protein n=1 Tax=Streptomyces sp. MST-110588 TaxID=2833628 RepID=UPI001F5E17A8|nr:hypothetical protein [Streptomyces sp. MST-110588]UNO43582.1 hypothetical protein KGS77_34020 [Streptomyces sp. MST-110588]